MTILSELLTPHVSPEDFPHEGLHILGQAHELADTLQIDPWQLAISRSFLQHTGMTETLLRYLQVCGVIWQKEEITTPEDDHRQFRLVRSLAIFPQSCFLLTEKGRAFLNELDRSEARFVGDNVADVPGTERCTCAVPRWIPKRRELWLNDELLKRFSRTAPNQMKILEAFQAQHWPDQISNPFHDNEGDPPEMLHNAVNRLNLGLKDSSVRFCTVDAGERVSWMIDIARQD